ncbi:MAG: hypothetical protein LBH43_08390 [Treponema sp.]|nr:hypothetical protein [Treponema sp.]
MAVNSCDFEPAEYISIYMINKTKETLLVYAGTNILFFGIPSAFIPAGGEQSVMVKKGESVIVYGKNTNRQYGSRSFNFETQWEIN